MWQGLRFEPPLRFGIHLESHGGGRWSHGPVIPGYTRAGRVCHRALWGDRPKPMPRLPPGPRLARVVLGVDIVELPRPHPVKLDDGLTLGPEEVVHLRRQEPESAGGDLVPL